MYWTVAALVLMLLPTYFQLLLSLVRVGSIHERQGYWKEIGTQFINEQVRVFFALAFLSYQAMVIADAIFRTIFRLTLTRKKLLEWETAAQSELGLYKKTPVDIYLDWTPWLSLAIGVALALLRPTALPAASPLLCLWSISKLLCRWLNRPGFDPKPAIAKLDVLFLRDIALRTWRFFRVFDNSDRNGLIPDNVQEIPFTMAQRISPTNLGLLLNARQAAFRLGYLTLREFSIETERTLSTAQRLYRYRGHFLNWYDTQTLQPLEPLFISTVDNGNLAGCLWTLKQGCLDMCRQSLFQNQMWFGIRDHMNQMLELADENKCPGTTSAAVRELAKRVEILGNDLSTWVRMLPVLQLEAERIGGDPTEWKLNGGEEFHWWVTEFLKRLQAIREMMEKFAPWLLPEYRALFDWPELELESSAEGLTLNFLPQFLADLDLRLQDLLQRDVVTENTRSLAHSLRNLLPDCLSNAVDSVRTLNRLANQCEAFVREMDFCFLFNSRKKLLSVGFDVKEDRLEESCYDLLASEARMAAFVAVAKGDIPQESWFRLGRAHTMYLGKRVLLSWTGTMFEYLMPALWMRSYPNTILERSLRSVVRCQQKYSGGSRVPWGISEAAHSERSQEGHYQYRAFGLPSLALKPSLSGELVISPYSSCLTLTVDPSAAIENLRRMKRMNWLGKFGFYEAADYTVARMGMWRRYELVRCWMAHHQGMSLLALCNLLTDSSIQGFFHEEPMVAANERMLHEKLPGTMPVTIIEELETSENSPLYNEPVPNESPLLEGEVLLKA